MCIICEHDNKAEVRYPMTLYIKESPLGVRVPKRKRQRKKSLNKIGVTRPVTVNLSESQYLKVVKNSSGGRIKC